MRLMLSTSGLPVGMVKKKAGQFIGLFSATGICHINWVGYGWFAKYLSHEQ